MARKEVRFPDVQGILEKAFTIDDVWEMLIEDFSSDEDDLDKIACANKLIELNNMRSSEMIRALDDDVREIKGLIRKISKKHNVSIIVKRRQKDLLGVLTKMMLLLKSKPDSKPSSEVLKRLRDFFGIRIIVMAEETKETQAICYELMNEILQFLTVKKNNTLANLAYYDKTERKIEGLLIPEKSLIRDTFSNCVKDYIWRPKERGYQCLHAAPTNQNKQTIEIQVRTMEMDIRAEAGRASHFVHKSIRYEGVEIPVDLTKVHIIGFRVLADEASLNIYDEVGLAKAIDPLNLLR